MTMLTPCPRIIGTKTVLGDLSSHKLTLTEAVRRRTGHSTGC